MSRQPGAGDPPGEGARAPAATEPTILEDRAGQLWLIGLVCAGVFVTNLDATIVNIALPTMAREFQVSPSTIAWVSLAYLVCETGFLLPFGKLADLKGGKPVFLAGFAVFLVGSILCATSTRIGTLAAFRALQGIGGGLLFTVMLSFISLHLPPSRRVGAMGLVTTSASLGFVLGPSLGGWISALLGWRWIFLVNIPFCLAAIPAAIRHLPADPPRQVRARLDFPGAAFSIAALVFFLFGVNQGRGWGWTSPVIVGSLLLSAAFAVAFVVRQVRAADPLVNPRIFQDRRMVLAMVALASSFCTVGGVMFLFPFFLVDFRHLAPNEAGMLMILLSVGQFVGPATGAICARFGVIRVCLFALGLGVLSFVLFLLLRQDSSVPFMMLGMGLFGLAQGLGKAPNTALVMNNAPPGLAHEVSSLLGLLRGLPMALGVLFFGSLFAEFIPHHVSTRNLHLAALPNPADLAPGFTAALAFGLFLSLVSLVAMSLAGREAPRAPSR